MSNAEKSTVANNSTCLQTIKPQTSAITIERSLEIQLHFYGTHKLFIKTDLPYTRDEVIALPEVEASLFKAGIKASEVVVAKAERNQSKNLKTSETYYLHIIDIDVPGWEVPPHDYKTVTVHIDEMGQFLHKSIRLSKRTQYGDDMPHGTRVYVHFQSEQVHKIHELPELLAMIPDIEGEVIGCTGFNPDRNIVPDIRLYKLFLK